MKTIVFMLMTLIFLASCSQVVDLHNKGLEKSVNAALDKKGVTEIDVHSLTDFDWDQAYLITPYTDQETINKQLGVTFNDPTNIAQRDDIYLLVFLDKNKVVQYIKIPTKYGQLMHGNKDGFTPSHATIKIQK